VLTRHRAHNLPGRQDSSTLAAIATYLIVGKKYPHLTGEGRLQPAEHDELEFEEDNDGALAG
jgi:hypothetical protein